MKFIKKILDTLGIHKHQFEKIGFKQIYGEYTRYSIRQYRCEICGKEKWVDGRFD